jgi:KaiC/GvpD/RAD55 family RecA-like ATPase
MNLAELIIHLFRGHPGYTAVGKGDGTFAPQAGPPNAARLARQHLAGEVALGFYLLDDESRCWCVAADYDSKPEKPDPEWKDKAAALYAALEASHLSPVMEVSQSGEGAHVWLFFSKPTPAWIPRAFLRELASKFNLSLREIYPRQDAHKPGGERVGNLVRFPLWNFSRFADPADDWKELDPVEVLSAAGRTTGDELCAAAGEMGFGPLEPTDGAELPKIDVGTAGAGGLSARVAALVAKEWSLIGRRWRGDVAGMNDPSASACAQSIATELVRLYVPTAEIAAALVDWCNGPTAARLSVNGKIADKAARPDWLRDTVANAYRFVIDRTERRSREGTTFQGAAHAFLDLLAAGTIQHTPSGVGPLDESIDGIAAGEVWVIGARPGDGKSALGCQWVDAASGQGMPALVISEEMSHTQIGKRRVMGISNLPQEHWSADHVPGMRREVDAYHKGRAPVHVVENCTTVRRAVEVIEQYAALHGVGIAAVDYAQLLQGEGDTLRERMGDVSDRLTQVAKRNGLRLLMLCQLSREVDRRGTYEPRMSDLMETSKWEQNADGIVFPWRPCLHDAECRDDLRTYMMVIAKRRNGPIRKPRVVTTFDTDRQLIGVTRLEDIPV